MECDGVAVATVAQRRHVALLLVYAKQVPLHQKPRVAFLRSDRFKFAEAVDDCETRGSHRGTAGHSCLQRRLRPAEW